VGLSRQKQTKVTQEKDDCFFHLCHVQRTSFDTPDDDLTVVDIMEYR
jgi:cold shock CspA family protein